MAKKSVFPDMSELQKMAETALPKAATKEPIKSQATVTPKKEPLSQAPEIATEMPNDAPVGDQNTDAYTQGQSEQAVDERTEIITRAVLVKKKKVPRRQQTQISVFFDDESVRCLNTLLQDDTLNLKNPQEIMEKYAFPAIKAAAKQVKS